MNTESNRVTLKARACMAVGGKIIQPGALFEVGEVEGEFLVADRRAVVATSEDKAGADVTIGGPSHVSRIPGWG